MNHMNQSSDIYGYHGIALVVDLTARAVRRDPIPESVLRNFIGGRDWHPTFFSGTARLGLIP